MQFGDFGGGIQLGGYKETASQAAAVSSTHHDRERARARVFIKDLSKASG